MNHLHPCRALVCALALTLSACSTTVESPRPMGDDSAEQVMAWIEVNRSNLPTGYDDFVRLPWAYRAGVFSAMSPVERSRIFRTHLERFSQEHPDLTAPQRALIDRMLALITPEWYTTSRESPDGEPQGAAVQKELERQLRAVFSPDELARRYAPLRPETPTSP